MRFTIALVSAFGLASQVASMPAADAPAQADTTAQASADAAELSSRPSFTVPSLTTVRGILAQLEAPIISTLTERLNLATSPDLYTNGGDALNQYLSNIEPTSRKTGRFGYGKLEYSFTLRALQPDHANNKRTFPAGTFHQDSYNANTGLFSWYVGTLAPTISPPASYFYHLDGSQVNDAAALNLDATLLALISHRVSIGRVVAETKYAANVSLYTPLIQNQDATGLRTLLTNTTQEGVVLSQAATAATAFSSAWIQAGAAEPSSFPQSLQTATASLFRQLIDTTTDIEVQYLLQRNS